MIRVAKKLAVLLGAGLLIAPASAIQITQVENKFDCPGVQNQQECAILWEEKFLQVHGDLVARGENTLSVRLLNGRLLRLPRECGICLNPLELGGGGRFLSLREQWGEGNTWLVLDRKSGVLTDVGGYPLFSPDGKRFVAAAEHLEAGYSRNILDVYRATAGGLVREFRGIPPEPAPQWAGRNVCWADNATITFRRTTFGPVSTTPNAEHAYRETPAALELKIGAWQVGASLFVTDRCTDPLS